MIALFAAAAIFLLVDPFKFFAPSMKPARMPLNQGIAKTIGVAIQKEARPAKKAVLDLFDSHQLVLVGDYGFIREEDEFFNSLIPNLGSVSVSAVGVDFLLSTDQPAIDALIANPAFDEKQARQLIIHRDPFRSNRQQLEIIKTVWAVNHPDPIAQTAAPTSLRLLGLSVDWDVALFAAQQQNQRDPVVLKKVFRNGLPDEAIAKTLEAEVLAKNIKAIALVNRESVFTGFVEPNYESTQKIYGIGDTRRSGRILADSYGQAVCAVTFHVPWKDPRNQTGVTWPVSGQIDGAMGTLANGTIPAFPFALDLSSPSFSRLPIADSDYIQARPFKVKDKEFPAGPKQDRFLGEFGALYIVLNQISDLHPSDPIPDLITEQNKADAARFLAAQNPSRDKPAEMNKMIVQKFENLRGFFSQFRQ